MSVSCVAPGRVAPVAVSGGLFDPVIVDNFAGLGGASFGIKLGAGRSVDVCVNHCPKALEFHARNHPETRHIQADVWEVDPFEAVGWDTVVHVRPGRRRPSHRRLRQLLKRAGKAVGLAWFSPDCRHFSPARGAAPVSPRVRSLAWIVVKYARTVRPAVMMVENVRAFLDWGPVRQRTRDGVPLVDKAGRPVMEPIPERKGETFRRWVRNLEHEGYVVEWKVLDAADYGVPQHRRRLFVVARRDGKPIKWPEKTHGPVSRSCNAQGDIDRTADGVAGGASCVRAGSGGGDRRRGKARPDELGARGVRGDQGRARRVLGRGDEEARGAIVGSNGERADSDRGDGLSCGQRLAASALKPYLTAADCIDWSIAPTSIFDRPREIAENTQRRLFEGFRRFVVDDADPFILRIGQQGGGGSYVSPVDAPVGSVVTKAEHCLVAPSLLEVNHVGPRRGRRVDGPMGAVTGGYGQALGGAYLAQVGYGERPATKGRKAQRPRAMPVRAPLGTVVGSTKHAVTVPVMFGCGGAGYSGKPTRTDRPGGTVLPHDRRAVAMPWLERLCGGPGGHQAKGRKLTKPTGAVTTRDQHALTAVHLSHFNHGQVQSSRPDQPARTVTAGGLHQAVVETELAASVDLTAHPGADARKITLTLAFLVKYYGVEGNLARLSDPLGTVTTRDRFAVVTVRLQTGATVDAAAVFTRAFGWCVVLDILMRMLTPRELARAQGFPDSYILPTSKSLAVKLIGNSVPPPVVAALTRANCPELCRSPARPRKRRAA